MPSKKPRVALILEDDLLFAIAELADAQDKPITTTIVELLKEIQPQIEGLAKLIRHAREGNKVAAKRALSHMVGDSLASVLSQQLELPVSKRRKR
jgi:hypothetical protein